ncbi:MAG: host attachment protein [Gammaproteobacteria bacterium]
MSNAWIVVAHRAGARIFLRRGHEAALELLERIEHPAGLRQDREHDSDRPGRTHDRCGAGRHALSSEESPRERSAADFARELAARLAAARTAQACDRVVLVAEPHLLGLLREALDEPTRRCVSGEITRDLVHVDDRDVWSHIEALL